MATVKDATPSSSQADECKGCGHERWEHEKATNLGYPFCTYGCHGYTCGCTEFTSVQWEEPK